MPVHPPSGSPPERDERFLVGGDFEPAYLGLGSGELSRRAEEAVRELAECRACPRECGVDRTADETRVCNTGRHPVVTGAFPHMGEEDCLRGSRGSGTIFFGQCNLGCVFCQNWETSQRATEPIATAGEVAALMLALQERGCHNINLVTPEHVAPQVIEAVVMAARGGLRLPIVYNTSGYDSLSTLALLDGIVDIYMPDFKLWTRESARRLLEAKDYPQRARDAIAEMHRQVGPLRLGADGVARRGLLIRHLVMPGLVDESAAIFEWLARELSPDTWVNIMGQYRPEYRVGRAGPDGEVRYADIDRRPTTDEMEEAHAAARRAGLWRFDERHRFLLG